MKMKLTAVLLCVCMLIGMTSCGSEEYHYSDIAPVLTASLDYAAEKDGAIECSVLVTAENATFPDTVKSESILLGSGFAEASDVTTTVSDASTLAIDFNIPKGELDATSLNVFGTIEIDDGVLLDEQGSAMGGWTTAQLFSLDSSVKSFWGDDDFAVGTRTGKLYLYHSGAYTAKVSITWDVETYQNFEKNPDTWELVSTNTASYTDDRWYCGQDKVIDMNETQTLYVDFDTGSYRYERTVIKNIHINIQGRTGIAWEKYRVAFDDTLEEMPEKVSVTIDGTTTNQSGEMTIG